MRWAQSLTGDSAFKWSRAMSIATATLSDLGLVAIPKEFLDEFHWQVGTELKMISSPSSILIQAKPKTTGRNLADLMGMLKHEGPALSTEALCKPVDYSADQAANEKRKA